MKTLTLITIVALSTGCVSQELKELEAVNKYGWCIEHPECKLTADELIDYYDARDARSKRLRHAP